MSNYVLTDPDGRLSCFVQAPQGVGDAQVFVAQRRTDAIEVKDSDGITLENLEQFVAVGRRLKRRKKSAARPSKTKVAANFRDAVTINKLPAGTRVSVVNTDNANEIYSDTMTDENLHIIFSTPGKYRVMLDPFPYRTFEVTIDVT